MCKDNQNEGVEYASQVGGGKYFNVEETEEQLRRSLKNIQNYPAI